MDIKHQKRDELRESLEGDEDLLRLAEQIKLSASDEDPSANFSKNLRKRLLNEHPIVFSAPDSEPPQLERGRKALLAKPRRRRLAWVVAPIAAVALLAVYSSFAAASPGFYEKYVPTPLKNVLQSADLVKTGGLAIETIPVGATIYIDGQEKGLSPIEIDDVRTGEHDLKITLDDFRTIEEIVSVEDGQIVPLSFELEYIAAPQDMPQDDEAAAVKPFRSQLVFLSDSALEGTSIAGDSVTTIAQFNQPIAAAAVTKSGTVYVAYNHDNGMYQLMQLLPDDQKEKAKSSGEISDLLVAAEGEALAYNNSKDLVVLKGSEKIVAEGANLKPLFINSEKIIYTDGQKVFEAKYGEEEFEPKDHFSADGAKIDPAGKQALYKTTDGLTLHNLESGETKIVFEESLTSFAWAGEQKALLETADDIKLLDLSSGEVKSLKQEGEDFSGDIKLSADQAGRTAVIIVDGQQLIMRDLDRDNTSTIEAGGIPVGFLQAGALPNLGNFEIPDSEALAGIAGKLDLPAADFEDIVTKGEYAYRISSGENSLEVISLADSSNPETVATLPNVNFNKEVNAAITGDKLVAVGGPMQVIDISDPKNPKELDRQENSFENIVIEGNRAYVSTKDKLQVYDISGSKPELLGEIELIGSELDLEIADSKIYVAAGEDGYQVINVSDPNNMSNLVQNKESFAHEIALTDKYAFVFTGSPGSDGEVHIYELGGAGKIHTIKPAFAGGEVFIVGNKLYSIFPKVAVYNLENYKEVIPLQESDSDGIIKGAGKIDLIDDYIVGLIDSTLYLVNVN
ncbi:PEGA domain-containing protein [Patescibacteria group bacterium]